ncbi:hypothetical protein [Cutibacterium phage PAVL21]|nr:hypothetical protein [Cutibacterium phage PAVL21]
MRGSSAAVWEALSKDLWRESIGALIYLLVGCVLVVRWSRCRCQHRRGLWCRLAGRRRACLRIRQPYRRWRHRGV